MDRLKYKIPRKLLDQFVDYSITRKLFEKEIDLENKNNHLFNKFDKFDPTVDPELEFYLKRRQHYRERNDMLQIFSKLNPNANPFVSKRYTSNNAKVVTPLKDIVDPHNIKEYVPKNYTVVKKDSHTNENQ